MSAVCGDWDRGGEQSVKMLSHYAPDTEWEAGTQKKKDVSTGLFSVGPE